MVVVRTVVVVVVTVVIGFGVVAEVFTVVVVAFAVVVGFGVVVGVFTVVAGFGGAVGFGTGVAEAVDSVVDAGVIKVLAVVVSGEVVPVSVCETVCKSPEKVVCTVVCIEACEILSVAVTAVCIGKLMLVSGIVASM